ncbi:MAG: hypothetical protein ACR2IS_19690 [Nitrososphaeraceae archaeon]
MFFNSKVFLHGVTAATVMTAILDTGRLSIGEVLGQQAADNINNNTSAEINTEAIEVSIVPGAAALGDKAYSPNPINIGVEIQ